MIWQAQERFSELSSWLDFRDKKILDIGCKNCDLERIFKLHERNDVYGIDINPCCKDIGVNLIKQDVEKGLPFPESYFDVIIALEIVEHLKNYAYFFSEVLRALKKGGTLIISTPNRNSVEGIFSRAYCRAVNKKWNAWDPTHVHIFSFRELLIILEKDFRIDDVKGLYFLCKPFEIISRLYPRARSIRKLTDKKFTKNKIMKRLAFNVIVKCTKR